MDLVATLVRYILSLFLFFSFSALLVLYYIMDFFSTFSASPLVSSASLTFFDYHCYDYLISSNSLNLNLISVYYFPIGWGVSEEIGNVRLSYFREFRTTFKRGELALWPNSADEVARERP